ncbi:MAG: carboxypeptidase regulatory-like domain-containing protein [Methanosphaera sp.]|nr:carboxypeptidase regulatory-like domain-containing protein [Methanosphaera sp.]
MTIGVKVTNTTDEESPVSEGTVVVKDLSGNELTSSELDNGEANITVPCDNAGKLLVVVEYQENDIYLASNATNKTTGQGVITIDVDKIPTNTTVEILNTTLGNVTIGVKVTNESNVTVRFGEVFVKHDGKIIANEELVNGEATITLPVDEAGDFKVVVEYQENDIYLASNATNKSTGEEEITIGVTKIPTVTSVEILNTTLGNVTIKVNVTNMTNESVVEGGVVVYDEDGEVLVSETSLDNGVAVITVPSSSAGPLKVKVVYPETDHYLTSNAINETSGEGVITIDVTKIPTVTNVEILSNVAGNVTIGVNVTNMTTELVDDGYVVVLNEDGTPIEGTLTQLTDGKATIVIPVENDDTLKVIVHYNENEIYLASNATNETGGQLIVIDVDKQVPTITIELDNDNVTIGDTVTISGVVTDQLGNPIVGGSVTVYINGTEYPTTTVDGGVYTVENVTGVAGVFSVNATYHGNDTVDSADSSTVNFTVNKIPTITTVEILNNTIGNITIGVKVTNTTDPEEPVSEGTVVVKDLMGNTLVDAQLENGEATIEIPCDTAGDLAVIVEYQETDIYQASKAKNESAIGTPQEDITIIGVNKIPTNTTVVILDTTLGNVTIGVNVTNSTGDNVEKGEVIVRNATNNKFIAGATLDGGVANITIPANSIGEIKLVVEYQENDIYYASNATNKTAQEDVITIDVTRIPTITSVEILNTTLGNVTIGVNVTNNTHELVSMGEVVVRNADTNEELITQELTNGKATIVLPVSEAGELRVKVEYQQNEIYDASNAINESAVSADDKDVIVIGVDKIPTKTTVEILNTTLGNVTIGVNVTNMTNDSVTIGNVTVKDSEGNVLVEPTKLSGGYATINIPVSQAGEFTVIVEYPENDLYLNSTAINDSAVNPDEETHIIIDVAKIPTNTTVQVLNNTMGNVTIGVQVTNSSGINVTKGNVRVKDLDGNVIVPSTELNNGYVELNVPCDQAGKLRIIVEYEENDIYLASNAKNESAIGTPTEEIQVIDVITRDCELTVNATSPVKAFENVTINGTLMDGDTPIADAEVEVFVDGESIGKVKTDSQGYYELNTTAEVGPHDVEVKYPGNGTYSPANESTTFTVDKIGVDIDAEVVESNPINTTIKVDVVDDDGNPVDGVKVTIKDEDGNEIGTGILEDGTVDITVPLGPGEHPLTIETEETDDYESSSEGLTVIVPKFDTELEVDPIEDVVLGENAIIGGKLTDEYGNNITNAEIIITVNDGEEIPTTTDEYGNYEITYPVDQLGENKVVVKYSGDDDHENATVETTFNVGKIPTKTTVTVLNNTATNVTIGVKVTNTTANKDSVTKGTVVVKDIDGNALVSQNLTNGEANITIPVDGSGKLLVQVEYQENDIYLASNATNESAAGKPTETITVIDVEAVDSNLTVSTDAPVKANESVTINGTLKDEYGNPIPNAPIDLSIDGEYVGNAITDDKGNYVFVTQPQTGDHTATVEYPGNETYNSANASTDFTVDKIALGTEANVTDTNPNNTTIQVNVTDEDGNPVDDVEVVIKDENGTVIGNGTVHNGTVNITVPLEPGNHDLTVETIPTDDYEPTTTDITVDVPKHNSTITPNPVKNTTYGNTTEISGKLTDEDGNPIPYADVTITVNGEEIPVQTDKNGVYNYTYPADTVGVNNVTVKYDGDDAHESTEVKSQFEVSKAGISIMVNPIKSYVEEEIILQANVTDANGDKITEGKVIFKINGVTLKEGGKLSGTTVLKVPVVDGVAKYTFTATKELISAKNITAVYIENEHYAENRTDGKTPANVSLRTAQVIASTQPEIGIQRQNITLVADIYDITHNLRDVRPINDAGSYVIFKVNGLTVKDSDGNVLKVPVVNGVAKTDYYIPNGMGGMKGNTGAYKNYTVTAVYHHPDYYDVRNTSNFNIEREDNVSFVVDDVKIDNRTVSIDANLVEADGDNLVGTNVVGVKINGLTLMDENGKPVLFNATNGVVDIDFKLPDNVKEVKNITLTTGNREAYGSATTTISKIAKQASVITVSPVTGIVEENITLSARVTDTYGNPVDGGYVIYKLNGQTLRKGGLLEGDNPIVKIGVKNGWANYTFVANNKLVSSKKIDAAYSGNANFNSSKTSTSSKVNITLRKAQVVVTATPIMAQQNKNIVFRINVTDKTHNKNNVAPINSVKSLATLKINGITLTDANNKTVQVSIRNGTGSYTYKIPQGVGGKVLGTDDYKNYTVVAHYTHPNYVDASNQTTYNIEQSTTSVQFYNVTFNQATKKITINAQIKDYQKNNVVGNTRFNIKVNGVTMKNESGDVIKYSSTDGKISLTIDSITSNPKEVMIVTLGREAYSSTRATYTTLIKV